MIDAIEQNLLREVADLDSLPVGAYNIRANGQLAGRNTTANIDIVTKDDKPGIDIYIRPFTKNESVHIPVILSQTGLTDLVYNDFHIGEGADVTIIAGCGIHNCGGGNAQHDGIHTFYLAKNAKLRYVEKHYGEGDGRGIKTMVQVHGVEYMAYSKRKLLSNYKEYTHLDFNVDKEAQIEIKANGVEDHCHIYEDQYGTHITSTNQMCALDVLNQFNDFDYLYIDGQYINETDLLEITHLYIQAIEAIKNQTYNKESIELMQLLYRLTPNVHYYHSFLFDSTVYKISDVRKREENERS